MANQHTNTLTNNQLEQHDIAVDYHLGQLTATEKAQFEEELGQDADLREISASAESMLSRLHLLSEPVAAPASAWTAVESAIKADKSAHRTDSQSTTAHTTATPQSLGRSWLAWLAGGSSALAALLLAIVLVPGIFTGVNNNSHRMPYTAVMQDANAEPMWLVKANTSMSTLEINNTHPLKIPYGHESNVCLLWVETANGSVAITKVPVDGSKTTVDIPPEFQQLLNEGGKLFITREYMSNDHDMPTTPSDDMESAGKFLTEEII